LRSQIFTLTNWRYPNMKKTLVALAALAATGASFGQVVLSGNIGPSFQISPVVNYSSTVAGATTTRQQGFQMQDGELNVTATEDLGGGYKAIAKGGLTIRGRDTAVVTRDASATLVTPFGAITGTAARTCGPWESMMTGVITGPIRSGNEGNAYTPLPKCSLIDAWVYTVPVGPVTAALTYGEFNGSQVVNAVPTTQVAGYAAGPVGSDSGNMTGLTFTNVAGTYSAGALMAGVDVTVFAQDTFGSTSAGRPVLDGLVRTRLVGSYNFGVAKLGLGYMTLTNNIASTMLASVAVPMGPVTFGLEYVARDAQGVLSSDTTAVGAGVRAIATAVFGATNGDLASSSIGFGATYNFSKLTNLNVSYIKYNDAGANSLATGATAAATAQLRGAKLDDEYRIRLLKSF
jgi:hypothetical protein